LLLAAGLSLLAFGQKLASSQFYLSNLGKSSKVIL
jgi:hypothetical protein